MAVGVLVDLTKCIGCGSCTVACKMYNDNKWIDDRAPSQGENARLADENWTVIKKHRVQKKVQEAGVEKEKEVWRFVKHQCLHCKEPACASACFAKAFQKTEEGPVIYYPHNCVGCRYCMVACPFGIPAFEWNKAIPVLTKCMLCYGKVKEGERPACVSVCPTNVMTFGDREILLGRAKEIIAKNPNYVQHIFGEEEAGGTSWIYISDVPFEQLGFKTNVPKKSIPSYTSKYMHITPIFGAAWALVLTGLYITTYFFTKRRDKVKASEKSDPKKDHR